MGNLLIVLVLMIGVIAIAQMMRVYEISSKLRGKKEEEISLSDNKFNATMMLVFMIAFYIFFFWLLVKYGNGGIGPAASTIGESTDWLLNFNFIIIIIVFFITNSLLFVFAYKYYHRPDRKGYWFPHDNKLELLWTSVPAVVLALIIVLGLKVWNEITSESGKDSVVIELYSKQFDWTGRYAGEDNKLGHANFRMINGENPLGVLTHIGITKRKDEIRAEIVDNVLRYYKHDRTKDFLKVINKEILKTSTEGVDADMYNKMLADGMEMVDKNAETSLLSAYEVMSAKKAGETYEKIQRLQRHLLKLAALEKTVTKDDDKNAMDDRVVKELVLIKGQEYEFKLRSMDVIHSAYMPHFRQQMNTVPGMITRMKFVPIYTTKEMRKLMNNEKFEYILLCNKICGAAHSNMQMKITVVEKKDEYLNWLAQQKTLKSIYFPDAAAVKILPSGKDSISLKDTINVAALNK